MNIRSLPVSVLRPLVPAAWLLAGGALAPAVASAQTSTVTAPTVITSVPYTITASGKYTLAYDFSYTVGDVPVITISAPNVNLDLGGYYVSGSGNTASSTPVISVGDVAGVVIKNGTVANEGLGIEFTGTSDPRDYVVEGVTFTHLYEYGVHFDNTAIAGKVYGCKFSDLGGTTLESIVVAIFTKGGVRSEKNTIDTLTSSNNQLSLGIYSNSISVGSDFAIGNTIANCAYGILDYTYLNNLTTNVTNPFVNGDAATGNLSVAANTDND